jgi:hypothetical protein
LHHSLLDRGICFLTFLHSLGHIELADRRRILSLNVERDLLLRLGQFVGCFRFYEICLRVCDRRSRDF